MRDNSSSEQTHIEVWMKLLENTMKGSPNSKASYNRKSADMEDP